MDAVVPVIVAALQHYLHDVYHFAIQICLYITLVREVLRCLLVPH